MSRKGKKRVVSVDDDDDDLSNVEEDFEDEDDGGEVVAASSEDESSSVHSDAEVMDLIGNDFFIKPFDPSKPEEVSVDDSPVFTRKSATEEEKSFVIEEEEEVVFEAPSKQEEEEEVVFEAPSKQEEEEEEVVLPSPPVGPKMSILPDVSVTPIVNEEETVVIPPRRKRAFHGDEPGKKKVTPE